MTNFLQLSSLKDNRATWEQIFAEIDTLEYDKPSNFDVMFETAKSRCFGITSVEYNPETYQLTFHCTTQLDSYQTVKTQWIIDSRVIQGFESEYELQGVALYLPDTKFEHEIECLFKGVYGTKKWMEMLNLLRHKGFQGVATESDGYYSGRVLLDKDVVTFQGATLDESFEAFVDSVEDYLKFKSELLV